MACHFTVLPHTHTQLFEELVGRSLLISTHHFLHWTCTCEVFFTMCWEKIPSSTCNVLCESNVIRVHNYLIYTLVIHRYALLLPACTFCNERLQLENVAWFLPFKAFVSDCINSLFWFALALDSSRLPKSVSGLFLINMLFVHRWMGKICYD